ncbi:glycerophosphodiester phosphodiesterase [Stackebrandtia albiflava]|nr:glycerophosphodiester phosphodiesterase family protein [Stackebrandtia albiflava]
MPEPMIVAHRGANVDLPEQTLPAYVRAVEVGADAVECDVRLTRDGHLVCHHDRTVDRTSNGRGAISGQTLAELQKLDFSGRREPVAGEQHQILPFVQLLRLINEAPRRVRMLVETKHPSRFGAEVERALHRALADFPGLDVTVMSFARAAVSRYRTMDPAVPLVWLYEFPLGTVPEAAGIVGPRLSLVRSKPDLIRQAHDAGRKVYVWTANRPEDVEFLAGLGADAVITDDPAMALATLGRTP